MYLNTSYNNCLRKMIQTFSRMSLRIPYNLFYPKILKTRLFLKSLQQLSKTKPSWIILRIWIGHLWVNPIKPGPFEISQTGGGGRIHLYPVTPGFEGWSWLNFVVLHHIINFVQQHEKFWWRHHCVVFMTSYFICGDVSVENQNLSHFPEILCWG